MDINQIAQEFHKAKTIFELETSLRLYLNRYGLKFFAFTYYSQHIKTGQKLVYDYVSSALKPWHNHYISNQYADVDRTLEAIFHETQPIFWDVQQQLANAKNVREKRIRLESIEFGIDKGLSIPIYGPDNDFATLTLHQTKSEKCLENWLCCINSRKYGHLTL